MDALFPKQANGCGNIATCRPRTSKSYWIVIRNSRSWLQIDRNNYAIA
ncbi:MAG: hypothetical protein JWO20_1308 [Candidatus Angelobacter sp.]|nr:hypothetical protein [Candidatus Angelobacter sp.]